VLATVYVKPPSSPTDSWPVTGGVTSDTTLLLLLPRQEVLHLSFAVSVPAGLVMLAAPLLPLKMKVSAVATGCTGWMYLRVTVAEAVLLLQSAAKKQRYVTLCWREWPILVVGGN
jgi:hypothetical protein